MEQDLVYRYFLVHSGPLNILDKTAVDTLQFLVRVTLHEPNAMSTPPQGFLFPARLEGVCHRNPVRFKYHKLYTAKFC